MAGEAFLRAILSVIDKSPWGCYKRTVFSKPSHRFEIDLPPYFRTDRVLLYLGRDPASVTEQVIEQRFVFGSHAPQARLPVKIEVDLGAEVASCRVDSSASLEKADREALRTQVHRLLGLVMDPRPFEKRASKDPEIARLIRGRRGLSIPQTATVFDALVWVIAGQQVSLPVAFALRRRLARRGGTPLAEGFFAPPTPQAIADLEYTDLHAISFSRRKAEYILDIARSIVEGRFDPEGLRCEPPAEVERRLLGIRGLGPWSVNYLMMRALGQEDRVPIGDAALTRNLKRFFALSKRPDAEMTERLMTPFAPHRSLATFHLWALKEEAQ